MSTTERFAHTMSLLDHPSDPMVMNFEVGYTSALQATAADFRRATLAVIERHEKLRFALRVEPAAFRPELAPADRAAALNQRAWSADHLSADDFRRQALPWDEAPLYRFKHDAQRRVFYVACHHCLMDGFGCYELALEIFKQLVTIEEPKALAYPIPKIGLGARLYAGWVGFTDELKKGGEIGKHPTTLLAPPTPVESQRHFFARADVPLDAVRETARSSGVKATVNDVILSAFHLSLEEVAGLRQTPDRLSVLVPVNMRPRYASNPRFVNRMGYVSVSTLPEHRKTPADVLRRVNAEMTRAKRFGKEAMVEKIMGLYESLGLMKRARKQWLEKRVPTRFYQPDKFFWKNFDTATCTNMGRIPVPDEVRHLLAYMVAYPPVMTPSVGLAVLGDTDRVTFGFRWGASVLGEEQGQELLSAFCRRLGSPRLEKLALPPRAA